jgi:hypothetical protein
LIPTGLLLIAAPQLVFKLMFSNGSYGDLFPRFAGALALALGILVVQIIRHRIDSLYPTIIAARVMICGVLLGLFFSAHDPFFLIVLGVVGFGVAWTSFAYLSDRPSLSASAIVRDSQ